MTAMLRVPRSRGVLTGTLLVLLGIWGGLIPFVGPYFNYAYTPNQAWTYTSGRLWLSILPAAATFIGGLLVLASRNRVVASFGGWLAALGGIWFIVGGVLSTLWTTSGASAAGTPVGGTVARAVADIGFFAGLGAAIVLLAAFALGRFAVIGARDAGKHRQPLTVPPQAGAEPHDRPTVEPGHPAEAP